MNTRKISDALTLSSPRKKETDAGEEAIVYHKKSPTKLQLSSPRKKEYVADSFHESFEEKKPEEIISEESLKAHMTTYTIHSNRRDQTEVKTNNKNTQVRAKEDLGTQQLVNQQLIENNISENKPKKTKRNCFGK